MTSSLRNTLLFAMLLAAIGLGTFYVKVWKFDYPTSPGLERTIWNFEIFLDFTGNDRPARLEIFVPTGAGDRGILEEQFFNGPFGLGMMGANQGLNRKAVWTYRYPSNRKVLRYKARIIGETLDSPLSSEMRLRIPRLQNASRMQCVVRPLLSGMMKCADVLRMTRPLPNRHCVASMTVTMRSGSRPCCQTCPHR